MLLPKRLLVGLALGCIGAVSLSVAVYRHLKVSAQSKEDVTDLLRDIEVTTNLNTTGINVLGDPKSDEVIARLIDYMVEPESRSATKEYSDAAMEALARIGKPAVPKLIEAIKDAPNKAASKRFDNGTKLSDFGIQAETAKTQTRAAIVLGRIGDARALPVLRGLPSGKGVMSFYVNEAIKSIEKANDRNTRPTAGQASSDNEVYAVYSAAIKGLYLDKGGRVKNGGPDSGVEQIVVIRDHTTIYGTPGSDTVSAWRTRGISIDDGTIEDFRRKSDEVVSLEPRFTPLVQQVLINDQEFASFFGKNGQSWRGFYQRYRNSIGCVALSPVGFNRDHNEALLYISRDCGNQCGNGYYVILGNQGTSWSVNHAVILFST